MAEVDTSSYPKPLPAKSPFEVVKDATELALQPGRVQQQKQALESNAITIDKQKLDLITQRYGVINKELTSLIRDPNLSADKIYKTWDNNVKSGFVTPEQAATEKAQIPAKATPDQLREHIQKRIFAADTLMDAIHYHVGQQGTIDTGQTTTPVVTSPKPGFGGIQATGSPIQHQLPPTTEVPTPGGTQRLGVQPYQPPVGALPVGPRAGVAGPSSNFGGTVQGATVGPNTAPALPVQQPTGPMASQPPMFEAGKTQLAQDQELATKKLTAIKPALQALPLMKDLMSSGPGTAPLTTALAGLSNAGLIPQGLTDKVAAQQEVIKKLYQYVSSNPVGQRSDAAQTLAEAGSPTPKVQILPALIKLTKDSIILDRVQAAMPNAFEDKDLSKYGKHRSMFPAQIDERAFGIDLMEPKERKALIADMMKKKNTYEGKKFWKSLDTVDKLGFINTSAE